MKPIINIKVMYKKKKPVWVWHWVYAKFADRVIPLRLVNRAGESKTHSFPIGVRVGIKRSKDVRFTRIRDSFFFNLLRFRVGKDAKKERNKVFYPIVKEMKHG